MKLAAQIAHARKNRVSPLSTANVTKHVPMQRMYTSIVHEKDEISHGHARPQIINKRNSRLLQYAIIHETTVSAAAAAPPVARQFAANNLPPTVCRRQQFAANCLPPQQFAADQNAVILAVVHCVMDFAGGKLLWRRIVGGKQIRQTVGGKLTCNLLNISQGLRRN